MFNIQGKGQLGNISGLNAPDLQNATTSKEEPLSETAIALQGLQTSISDIEYTISALKERIYPVLKDFVVKGQEKNNPEPVVFSPIGNALKEQTFRLENQKIILQEILSRLAI